MQAIDCRLKDIVYFERYREFCDRVLKGVPVSGHVGVVLSVPGESLLFCQFSFPWERSDSHKLKMLQPIGYLKLAWSNLSRTHQLRTILVFEPDVQALIDQNSLASAAGWVVRLLEKSTPIPLLPALQSKAEKLSLFGWLSGSVVDEVLKLRLRFRNSEMVDPTVLPRAHGKMLDELVKTVAKTPSNTEALSAYLWMGHIAPLAEKSAYVRNRIFTSTGQSECPMLLSLAFGINDILCEHLAWTNLMGIVVTAWARLNPQAAASYHCLAVDTLGWRLLSADPNALLRNVVLTASEGKLFDPVIEKSEPFMRAFAFLQLGYWYRDTGDYAKASDYCQSVLKCTTGILDANISHLGLRAALLACEVAFRIGKKAQYLEALVKLETGDFDLGSTNWPAYRVAKISAHFYRAQFHVLHERDIDAVRASLERGLEMSTESPCEACAPSVLAISVEILKIKALMAMAQDDRQEFRNIARQMLEKVVKITDFRPDSKRLTTSLVPASVGIHAAVWLLSKIGSKMVLIDDHLAGLMRASLINFIDTLNGSEEFSLLKSHLGGFEKIKLRGFEELFEVKLTAAIQNLS